ncbi:MAG: hypothetical protein ACKVVT_04585 [Dehalococcoidia bacterium]
MPRPFPPAYANWERLVPAMRSLAPADLASEVTSSDPARRMAALAVVDIATTSPGALLEWVRTLPDVEANTIAGAIQVQVEASDCRELLRWAGIARVGYEQRGLATYLVLLFAALEALDRAACHDADDVWAQTAGWVCDRALGMLERGEREAFDDLSLFVFENHLDRAPLFAAFKALLAKRRELALRVSANPGLYLSGLPDTSQREMLDAAEKAGGIPLTEAWKLLHGVTVKRDE